MEAGVPTQEQLHGRAVAEMLRHALDHGFDATDIATGMQRAEVKVLHGTVTQVAQVAACEGHITCCALLDEHGQQNLCPGVNI